MEAARLITDPKGDFGFEDLSSPVELVAEKGIPPSYLGSPNAVIVGVCTQGWHGAPRSEVSP